MPRNSRIILAVVGSSLLLATILAVYVWHGLQGVQPFYEAALETNSQELAGASRKLESRVAALCNDVVEQPRWQAIFSETEVNGWLAVALAEKYPELLPETVTLPRVALAANACQIGFRYQDKKFNTVLSVKLDAFAAESNQIAIRLLAAHAGTLPWPISKITDPISQWAREQNIPLRWSQQDGDPIALLPIEAILSNPNKQRQLELIELKQGELILAGKTVVEAAAVPERSTQR